MNKFRNFLLLSLFVVALTLMGCRNAKEVELDAVFPENIDFAFVVDYSDEDQRENFRNILEKFEDVDPGILNMMGQQFKMVVEQDGFDYEEDIKPIFDEPWKMGVGMNLPAEDGNESLRGLIGSIEMYIVLQLEEADKFGDFVEELAEKEQNIKYEEDGEAEYWSNGGDGTFVRYEDIFVLTMNLKQAKEAVGRLENGGGLNENETFERGMAEGARLGYFYMNFEKFGEFAGQAYEEIGFAQGANIVRVFETMYFSIAAEESGIVLDGTLGLDSEEEAFETIFPNLDYRLSLMDKVNGDGLMLFAEQPSFENIFRFVVESYQIGMSGVSVAEVDENGELVRELKPVKNLKSYEDFLEDFAGKLGIEGDKFADLVNSPFALSVSLPDEDKVIPAVALYLKLEDDEIETAKIFLAVLDADMNELLVEFDKLMIEEGGKAGFIKKNVEIVNGGGIRKLSLDWNPYSKEELDSFGIAGLDFDQIDSDLYYGLTGDNVLVVALFSDFPEFYGKNVVSKNKGFMEALGQLNMQNVSYVDYVNVKGILNFLDKIIKVGELEDDDTVLVLNQIRPILEIFEYLVGGSEVSKDFVRAKAFVKTK